MKPNLTTIILMAAVRWIEHIRFWRNDFAEHPEDLRSKQLLMDFVRWVRAKWQAWHSLTRTERMRISARMTFQELLAEERQAIGAPAPLLLMGMTLPSHSAEWAHDVFGAAFELFGKIWPVVGLGMLALLLGAFLLVIVCLVDACRHGPGAHWAAEGVDGQDDARFEAEGNPNSEIRSPNAEGRKEGV